MTSIAVAKRALKKAEIALENAILDRMAEVAIKKGITEMVFYFDSTYYKGGKKVNCKELDKLENVYIEEINDRGFIARWTVENGWH